MAVEYSGYAGPFYCFFGAGWLGRGEAPERATSLVGRGSQETHVHTSAEGDSMPGRQ